MDISGVTKHSRPGWLNSFVVTGGITKYGNVPLGHSWLVEIVIDHGNPDEITP